MSLLHHIIIIITLVKQYLFLSYHNSIGIHDSLKSMGYSENGALTELLTYDLLYDGISSVWRKEDIKGKPYVYYYSVSFYGNALMKAVKPCMVDIITK